MGGGVEREAPVYEWREPSEAIPASYPCAVCKGGGRVLCAHCTNGTVPCPECGGTGQDVRERVIRRNGRTRGLHGATAVEHFGLMQAAARIFPEVRAGVVVKGHVARELGISWKTVQRWYDAWKLAQSQGKPWPHQLPGNKGFYGSGIFSPERPSAIPGNNLDHELPPLVEQSGTPSGRHDPIAALRAQYPPGTPSGRIFADELKKKNGWVRGQDGEFYNPNKAPVADVDAGASPPFSGSNLPPAGDSAVSQ